eukprot:SAG11_NODE_1511_length_4769_cov_3.389722_3_plen_52_part_00
MVVSRAASVFSPMARTPLSFSLAATGGMLLLDCKPYFFIAPQSRFEDPALG